MERLLLHSCCAPCSSGVLEQLIKDYDVTVFFYNPNMDSEEEYDKRAKEQMRFLQQLGISYVIADYNSQDYENVVKGLENEKEGGARCVECFRLRLTETCKFAKEHNYDVFTTTLSVSPYKNHELLNKIGEEVSQKYGVPFLSANFKKNNGYLRSIENSKKYGLYRQNYCGCKYSKNKDH